MSWLDLVFVILIALSAFMGLKIGLIRAGFTTLGIFVGSILGGQLSDDIGGIFTGIDSDGAVATVVSYAVIITICLTVSAILAMIIRKVLTLLFMGWADRLADGALGLAAGSVISAGVIMGMENLIYSSEVGFFCVQSDEFHSGHRKSQGAVGRWTDPFRHRGGVHRSRRYHSVQHTMVCPYQLQKLFGRP